MPREATFSQHEFDAAAAAILAAGGRPTARSVRAELGQGSMSTIVRMLKVWKAQHVLKPAVETSIPEGLERSIRNFVALEVDIATKALRGELATLEEEMADLLNEAERDSLTLDSVLAANESLRSLVAEKNGQNTQLAQELESARNEGARLRREVETGKNEQLRQELRLELLSKSASEMEQLKAALDAERTARIVAEKALAVCESKLEQVEAQVREMKRQQPRHRSHSE